MCGVILYITVDPESITICPSDAPNPEEHMDQPLTTYPYPSASISILHPGTPQELLHALHLDNNIFLGDAIHNLDAK
jgi:hypothetical protein